MHPTTPVAVAVALATRLTAAMREQDPPERVDTRAGVPRPYGKRPIATVRFEGVTVDENGIAEVYRVTPDKGLKGPERVRWSSVVKAWARDPSTWRTEAQGDAVRVRHVLSIRDFSKHVRAYLGDDAAASVPVTIARPVEPRVPLAGDELRLALGKVLNRTRGAVPVAVVRNLVAALPGWICTSGTFARRVSGWSAGQVFHATLGETYGANGTGLSVDADGACVLIRRIGGKPLNEADVALVLSRVQSVGPELLDDAPVTSEAGTYLAQGITTETDHMAIAALRQPTAGFRFVAPDGAQYVLYGHGATLPGDGARSGGLAYDDGFWVWAYRHGLADLTEGVIAATDPEDLRDAAYGSAESLVNTGECQLCTRRQKLKIEGIPGVKVLVDHGYEYPEAQGWRGALLGERAGSCNGVSEEPYEKSCEALKRRLPAVRAAFEEAERRAEAAQTRLAERAVALDIPKSWLTHAKRDASETVTLEPTDSDWPAFAKRAAEGCAAQAESVRAHFEWIEKRVERWTLRPLYDERMAAKKGVEPAMREDA